MKLILLSFLIIALVSKRNLQIIEIEESNSDVSDVTEELSAQS